MARIDTLTNFLTDVAAAIKTKKGDETAIPAADFDTEIANLPSGGSDDLKDFIERNNIENFTFPSGVTKIGNGAFCYYKNLALTSLPSGITSIGNNAFGYCTNLTSITFEGTPKTMYSSIFNGCKNLTTINVPWAEGEVANAPWGATNATINYNYTGE